MQNNMETNKVYNESCIETMKRMADKSIDLVLCDPPYGVNYEYDKYQDTPENLQKLVNDFMPEVLRVGKRVAITCGNGNQHLYPKPDWTLAWVISAGAGQNKWGFTCWQPILVYGKDPFRENRMGARPDIIQSNETSKDIGHSCSKPQVFWTKLLQRLSVKDTDIVYDPFMGSGTTAVACITLKKKWIGSEISAEYTKLSEERINSISNTLF